MTLRELRAAHPDLFYAQDWFAGEAFMEIVASDPSVVVGTSNAPGTEPVHAVDLATLYVRDPHNPLWRRFLWTDDVDHFGNRVYVGGCGRYGCEGFQIHRHLESPDAVYVHVR